MFQFMVFLFQKGLTALSKLFRNAFFMISLFFISVFYMTNTYAAGTVNPQSYAELTQFFNRTNSLQGTFTQTVSNKKGKVIQNSTGSLSLQRPGKFRWAYKTPDEQTIVGDGRNIWFHDLDLEQVTVKPFNQSTVNTPVALLVRKQNPDIEFNIKPLNIKGNGYKWYQLTPKKPSNDFKTIQMAMKQGNIVRMVLIDQLSQKTDIKFSLKANQAMNGSLFQFKVPEDTDLIGKPI